jgi:hypothetical protein
LCSPSEFRKKKNKKRKEKLRAEKAKKKEMEKFRLAHEKVKELVRCGAEHVFDLSDSSVDE